jgi:uncharacterized protein (TIGR03086 family)
MTASPMPAMPSVVTLAEAVGLVERAVGYTRGSLQLVRPDLLDAPTPCDRWNLGALLGHMYDSLSAMHEAAEFGRVELVSVGEPGLPMVNALQDKACALLGGWVRQSRVALVIGGDAIAWSSTIAAAGALEIAVHGWDVAQACGADRPIPAEFADELLTVAEMVVTEQDRGVRFAQPIPVDRLATGSSDRLLRFLGRG